CSGLGILGPIDEASDACVSDGSGAHRTGLNRHVNVAVEHPVIADGDSSLTQSDDLRVSRGVVQCHWAIATASDNLAIAHDYGSHRNLAERERTLRLAQGFFHEQFVSGGHA